MHVTNQSLVETSSDRIPTFQKLMFSSGCTLDYYATSLTMSTLWMPFFNIGLGISPVLLGIILMVLRGWDAFLDPVIGNLSDNTRTRWGRRRPFMAVGAVLTAAFFPLLWRPPAGWGPNGMTIYLLIIGMLFFVSYSCWSMPYFALQLELTPNYDERTRLTAWMTVVSKFTSFGGFWAMAIISCSWFANPVTGKPDIVHGVRTCSWFIALIILVFGLLPPLFVRERYYESEVRQQPREAFWKSIGESLHCGPLWDLIGISFFLVLGSSTIGALGQYVNIYFVNDGKLAQAFVISGWVGTSTMVAGVLSIPVWVWLSEKLDKKIIVAILLSGGIFGHLLNYICLRRDMPYLQLIPAVFQSGTLAAIWMFLPSMKADVSDYEEHKTSRRREGALNSFYAWFVKAAITASMGLGGLVLQLTGFNVKLPAQTPAVLLRMELVYILLPVVIWAAGIFFIWHYPLDRERMRVIRDELEIRRGKI